MKKNMLTGCIVVLCLLLSTTVVHGEIDFKKVIKKYEAALNASDLKALGECYAEDALIEVPGEDVPLKGRKALMATWEGMPKAFPDFRIDFLKTMVSGNTLIIEWRLTGTHTGPMATPEGDIPATGKKIDFKGVMILELGNDGLITSDRTYFDQARMMGQLGLMK